MNTIALVLLMTGGALPAAAVTLPVLTTAARVLPLADDPFCESGQLERFLPRRLFTHAGGRGLKAPDLTIECSSGGPEQVRVRVVLGSDGPELAKFGVRRHEHDLTARLIAEKLAESPKVIEAAQRAMLRENGTTIARLAMESLKAGKWSEAVDRLTIALESDAERAPLHKALSIASAELGRTRKARWHYVAYARAENIDADEGDADLVSLIRRKYREGAKDEEPSDEELRKATVPLAESKDAREYHRLLREIVKTAPWSEDVCTFLSKGVAGARWKLLARHWKERARFARAVIKDSRRFRELNALLEK